MQCNSDWKLNYKAIVENVIGKCLGHKGGNSNNFVWLFFLLFFNKNKSCIEI